MSNLQRFNNTLTELEKELDNLKGVSRIYKKIENLVKTYETIIEKFGDNNKKLTEINNLQQVEQEKISTSLLKVENFHQKNKQDILDLLVQENALVRKENKEFYTDLENTVKIKLDDNKSQIKQLIENERNYIKDIFEIEFTKNTNELRKEIDRQSEIIIKNQKITKLLLGIIIFCGICAALGIWVTCRL